MRLCSGSGTRRAEVLVWLEEGRQSAEREDRRDEISVIEDITHIESGIRSVLPVLGWTWETADAVLKAWQKSLRGRRHERACLVDHAPWDLHTRKALSARCCIALSSRNEKSCYGIRKLACTSLSIQLPMSL